MAGDAPSQQRDQDIVAYQSFSGLRNDIDPDRFGIDDLAVANNVDIDKSGRVARRPGYTKVLSGTCHSVWSDNNQCFVVANGNLCSLSSAYVPTVLAVLKDPLSWVSFIKINDTVYFSNGTDIGVIEAKKLRSWGLPVPPPISAIQMVGYMPKGTYQYLMTYVRSDGQESGAGVAGQITLIDGSALGFSLPVSTDATIAAKNIYVTTPNGDKLYLAMQVTASATTAMYSSDTRELTVPLLTQFLGPAPAGQLLGYYRGHAFVAAGNILYPSEPFAYELFDMRKGIQFNDRITLFAAMEDKERQGDSEGMNSGVFIGTTRSCGVLVGKEASGFQYVPKMDYGAIEGAVAFVDGSLYGDNSAGARQLPMWLTTQGVCVGMPQLEIKNLTRTRYGMSLGGKGSACFIPGPNKFIATSWL
jgi:hypothetical protein